MACDHTTTIQKVERTITKLLGLSSCLSKKQLIAGKQILGYTSVEMRKNNVALLTSH